MTSRLTVVAALQRPTRNSTTPIQREPQVLSKKFEPRTKNSITISNMPTLLTSNKASGTLVSTFSPSQSMETFIIQKLIVLAAPRAVSTNAPVSGGLSRGQAAA